MNAIVEYLSNITNAAMWLVSIGIAWLIINTIFMMIYKKITCNNRFYKRELKDRNNIIAELLNSRNR